MNDLLPTASPVWQYLETQVSQILRQFGYHEIRFPILESTDLFRRGIGEATDIIEKEMYTFLDRNGDSLSLRPEGTASCVRACEEHGLLYNQTQRLWYQGPMFRYERPQKGRLRQFHQIGIETFGFAQTDIELELLVLLSRLWRQLGLSDKVSLQINSLGDREARAAFRAALVDYLQGRQDALDEDSRRRLETNPLRILDSKVESTQALLEEAPLLHDYLSPHSREQFATLQAQLAALGIHSEWNPRLVRGLDYYNDTVFEWVTTHLGSQGTVCAGGRYDKLVAALGGRETPAFGCAMGVERLALLLQEQEILPKSVTHQADVYVSAVGENPASKVELHAFTVAETLREAHPALRVIMHCGGGSLKNQLKRADKSGAQVAVIVGETEWQQGLVGVKPLRFDAEQELVSLAALPKAIEHWCR